MTELLAAAQMRAIEQAAIDSGAVTGLELMERAGRGVVEAIFEEWPELKTTSQRAVLLCGPGNNGGDGFVVARLLKEWGWEVEVFLHGNPERLPPDARVNHERWVGMGEVMPYDAFKPFSYSLRSGYETHSTLIIDALFGTGLSRLIDGKLAQDMADLAKLGLGGRPAIVSIDVPSGLCADSGRGLGQIMPSEQVVTFHLAKVGHYLAEGAEAGVMLSVKDIGIRARGPRPFQRVQLVPSDPIILSSGLDKSQTGDYRGAPHKYSHGHAFILSGPSGRGGAARLAARGALRIGAGLVTVGCPPEALAEHAARLDAIMLREVPSAPALADLLQDRRINALCLGPGMGTGDGQAGLLAAALRARAGEGAEPRHLVLDADALTLLAQRPDVMGALHGDCVLTPHGGEFARLFPDIAEKLNAPASKGPAYSKVDATREAARRAGCVVLFKGPDTVIADPSGRCAINSAHYDRAAPWLATAGSGDVLAGFITGLLARGFSAFDAACTAAWLHVDCALSFGPGLIAEDLPEELPKVFRKLGL
ncbi:NAD(P)H-hydrate dehydratase [Gemmobacter denitrificans]|uniref:Bifunctional NAD(P)H-hydrate repair enzyme n=1 Tax=Gemmobacter denitrificans TaxID=3123040 RepID=A0ABU8BWR9_9RHOB